MDRRDHLLIRVILIKTLLIHADLVSAACIVWILELSNYQISDLIVDRRTDKNNAVLEQPRVNIERPFAPRRLFDNHWY